MTKKRIKQWATLCATAGIAGNTVIGYGSSASKPDVGSEQTSRETADGTGIGSGGGTHIGVILIKAGLEGNSFNDLALEGIKKAAADYGIAYDEVEPKSASNKEIIQDEMATPGDYGLAICVGAEQMDVLTNAVSTYPEQRSALLDIISNPPNVASYSYKEQERMFLAGALTALAKQEKTDDKLGDGKTVGFTGSVDNPLINRFVAGYKARIEYIELEIKVLVDYMGGLNDPTIAKAITNTFVEKGADVIFHATGASGMDMSQAAEEKGSVAIGANLNQSSTTPGYIIAGMPEKPNSCTHHAVVSIAEDTYTGENQMLGLNDGGVDVAVEGSNVKVSDNIPARLDELEQKIIPGEIQIPFELN